MNILIECSNRNYLGYLGLCKVIRENYKQSKFGCLTNTQKIKKVFDNSNLPSFKVFDSSYEDKYYNFNTESDLSIIRQFEDHTGASIWKLLSSDRKIGWTDNYGNYGTFIQKKLRSNKSFVLHRIASDIKFYSNVFKDFKPDIFIPAMAMGTISVIIIEALCKSSGVRYLLPEYSRISNLHRISEDTMCLSPEIDKEYDSLLKANNIEEYIDGKRLYEETRKDFSNLNNLDTTYIETYDLFEVNNLVDQAKLFYKFIFITLKDIFACSKKIVKDLLLSKNVFKLNIYKLFLAVKINLQRYLNQKTVFNRKFGSLPDINQKYLYFPLYNSPEYSTNFQSVMWPDIISIIELLAKSIPGDWIIVLKEHPTGLEFHSREVTFYKKIKRFPNVIFAPLKADSEKLICNSELVFVTVGTSGWEAILNGKPVISPVKNFWDCMNLSSRCSDIESLGEKIKLEVKRNISVSQSEREKRIIFFLQALFNNSFPISNPEVFSFFFEGTNEQYSKHGLELGVGFIDFMKKIDINKVCCQKKYFEFDMNYQGED